MTKRPSFALLRAGLLGLLATIASASASAAECFGPGDPEVSFISFKSPNLQGTSPANATWTVEGKLSLPPAVVVPPGTRAPACRPLTAVLILHGSAGVDSRGDFYEAALNAVGIATLQIDMWQARGVTSVANRPAAPILTYGDAFAALNFLASQPRIDPNRIGVLGFSWGGVVSLAAAEQLYNAQFATVSGGRRFAAHVANYPVCYGANNLTIPALQPPAATGTQFLHLTGAPVMIQIGSNDSYDNGVQHCMDLAASVNPGNGNVVSVNAYPGAFHAFDRLMVPETELDPFANEGSYFSTGVLPQVKVVPDVAQARLSRQRVTAFFQQKLQGR